MDRSIPIGKRWSIGLDGIVGLFPGVGDLAGSFVSALIVASATQAGLPRAAIARMVTNVAVDTVLGGIPFIGDFFDFASKRTPRTSGSIGSLFKVGRRRFATGCLHF
jgi:hypothetical protein